MRRRLVGALFVIASAAISMVFACISDDLVECSNGLLCAPGMVCTVGGCADPEAVAACDGLADGDPCLRSAGVAGTCNLGACHEARCGNMIIDLGEVCDDGNTVDLDSCSRDCLSDERCGNAAIDLPLGEQCDRGMVGLSGDGCSSTCQVEFDVWRSIALAAPSPRANSGVAIDVKGRILRIGGTSGSGAGDVVDEVVAWDGRAWRDVESATKFPPRARMAAAYDSDRKRIVVFGGHDAYYVASAETWEWDGIDWLKRNPTMVPSGREARMAYDPLRKRMVMLGGGETWEYDGSIPTWTLQATSGPSSTMAFAMVFEPSLGKVLLVASDPDGVAQTWTWDGTAWTNLAITTPQSIRYALGRDERMSTTLLVTQDDTYRWQSAAWIATNYPLGQHVDGIVYQPERASAIAIATSGPVEWSGSASWSFLTPTQQPTGQLDRVAYDSARGRIVASTSVVANAMSFWEWDGGAWENVPAPPGSGITSPAMDYDTLRRRTVLFGGLRDSIALNITWTWDGLSWVQQAPAVSPTPRVDPVMAFDHARGHMVLHGGTTSQRLNDTWTWDGVTWTQRTPAASPPPRSGAAMGYDAASARIIMFGGVVSGNPSFTSETWAWDGTSWQQLTPVSSPPPRMRASLVFDWRRNRLVLVGGNRDASSGALDVWDWDGVKWTEREPFTPLADWLGAAALDVRGDLQGMAKMSNDLRRLRSENLHPREHCLSALHDADQDGLFGCVDPDCWPRCQPSCTNGSCDPAAPRCGDGSCNAWLEDHHICPDDCSAP